MTAPDGRTFTFEEWCAYLNDEDDHDVNDPYIGMDGKVFEIDGFRYNVHGHCLNPHKFRVGPPGDRVAGILCYYDVRTYRNWKSLEDRRPVWYADTFEMNCGAHAYGFVEGDEYDAILECLRQARKNIIRNIEWNDRAIENHKLSGDPTPCTYSGDKMRSQAILKLTDMELEKRMQLSLF